MADGFNFDNFSKQLEEQRLRTEQRQAVAVETQDRQTAIRKQSADLSSRYAKDVGFLKESAASSQQKADHARQLADSGNPMDSLRLMGLQMMDPGGYDRSTRTARMAEDMQRASAIGNYYGIQQQALEAQLMLSTTDLDRAKLAEEIGQERLNLLVDQAAMVEKNLAASKSLQSAAMASMDLSQVDAALQQAQLSPQRQVNVGGIDLGLTALQDRKAALEEREFLLRTRRSLDERVALEEENQLQQSAESTLRTQQLRSQLQERNLATMNEQELLEIRLNGYKDNGGTAYDPPMVDQAFARVQQVQSDSIQRELAEQTLGQFDVEMLAGQKSRLESIAPRLPANSPASKSLREFQSAIGITSNFIGKDQPLSKRITAVSAFQQAEEKFEKAIQAQAKFEASKLRAGEDRQKLEEMLVEYYRGNEVPLGMIYDIAQTRLTQQKSLVDILPPQIATHISSEYNRIWQEKLKGTGGGSSLTERVLAGNTMTAEDRKIAQAEAARQAVDSVVNAQVGQRAQAILSEQVEYAGHPLNGVMSKTQFANLMMDADQKAKGMVQGKVGLSDSQMELAMAGRQGEGVDSSVIATVQSLLKTTENTNLLLNLDSLKPGLAREFVDWWQKDSANYVAMRESAKENQTTSFGESVNNGLQKDYLQQAMDNYAAGIYSADSSIKDEVAQRNAELITFGGDPEQSQVIMLNAVKELESSEKGQLWKEVFTPLLAEAKLRKLDFKATNQFIEQALQGDSLNISPGTKSLMKTLRRTRPDVLSNLTNYQSWGKWFFGSRFQGQPNPSFAEWYPGKLSD